MPRNNSFFKSSLPPVKIQRLEFDYPGLALKDRFVVLDHHEASSNGDAGSAEGGNGKTDGAVDPIENGSSSTECSDVKTTNDLFSDKIMTNIFRFLDLKSRIMLERTCKRWKTLVEASWSEISVLETGDVVAAFSPPQLKERRRLTWYLAHVLKKCGDHLKTLKFTPDERPNAIRDCYVDLSGFVEFGHLCPNLERFEAFHGILFDCGESYFSDCPKMVKDVFKSFPKLDELVLTNPVVVYSGGRHPINYTLRIPVVTKLALTDVGMKEKEFATVVKSKALESVILRMGEYNEKEYLSAWAKYPMLKHLSELALSLYGEHSDPVTKNLLSILSLSCQNLSALFLCKATISSESLRAYLNKAEDLEVLVLVNCEASDSYLSALQHRPYFEEGSNQLQVFADKKDFAAFKPEVVSGGEQRARGQRFGPLKQLLEAPESKELLEKFWILRTLLAYPEENYKQNDFLFKSAVSFSFSTPPPKEEEGKE